MTFKWVGWTLTVIVFLLVFTFLVLLARPGRLIFTGKITTGVIAGADSDSGLVSPKVRFETSGGKRLIVSSRVYSETISVMLGHTITVLYDPKNPANAQLLMWREFAMPGILLGLFIFVSGVWIGAVLMEPSFDDPAHILSSIIARYHLSPRRLPVFFTLGCVIISTGPAAYINSKNALSLRDDGIKVTGHVIGTRWAGGRSQQGDPLKSAEFATISYRDLSGRTYTIRRSLAKPLSRLQEGDAVEVVYPPGHPEMAVVNTWDELYLLPAFFLFMFLAFSAVAFFLLRGNVRL
ncbi:MAG: DUF3592 domain-containing protein [Sphingobacteriales bacterium]